MARIFIQRFKVSIALCESLELDAGEGKQEYLSIDSK